MGILFLFFLGVFGLLFDLYFSFFFFSVFLVFLVLGSSGFWFGGLFFFDGVSFFLVFLSAVVFLFCLFSSLSDWWGANLFGYFYFYLSLIYLFLVVSFSCFSVLVFYISFEFIFALMFLFLLNWGYSPERLMASYYMVFYTLVVSFPFLVFLVLSGNKGAKFFMELSWSGYWWVALLFVFFVKLPVYGVHLWLPKAHVEAPVSGSMVLAGVLLKLGTYGILRLSGGILGHLHVLGGYFVSVGLVGGLYSCFLCLRQADLKAFVAYSSVCHMGFGLSGLYSGNTLGAVGGIFMMVSHGFCSSCLFYLLYVLYERFSSRSGLILKGMGFVFPVVLLVWFVFSVLNMGVPPSFSFFSELLILVGVTSFSLSSVWFSGFLLLFSGFYGIYFYVISCHSSSSLSSGGMFLGNREFLLFYGHFYFLVFLIFSLDSFFF